MKPKSNFFTRETENICEKIKHISERIPELIPKEKRPFVIVAFGILLMLAIFLLPSGTSEKNKETKTDEVCVDFASQTEKKLCDIISSIDGAGRCKVMVITESGEENIYAENIKGDNSEYVVIKTSSNEGGLLLKTVGPKIRGVAIVCDGGDKFTVKNDITQTVCAALGISSTRVSVTKMENQEGNHE